MDDVATAFVDRARQRLPHDRMQRLQMPILGSRIAGLVYSGRVLKFFGENVGFFGAQFTYGSFLMIVIFAVLWYMLNRTAWGRHVYAVGDDPEAAAIVRLRQPVIARVHAIIRRAYGSPAPRVTLGDVVMDTAAKRVQRNGVIVELTAREYAILEILADTKPGLPPLFAF